MIKVTAFSDTMMWCWCWVQHFVSKYASATLLDHHLWAGGDPTLMHVAPDLWPGYRRQMWINVSEGVLNLNMIFFKYTWNQCRFWGEGTHPPQYLEHVHSSTFAFFFGFQIVGLAAIWKCYPGVWKLDGFFFTISWDLTGWKMNLAIEKNNRLINH